GYLVRETLRGPGLGKVRASIGPDRLVRVRLEVSPNARHKGGLAVYGENAGCYPVEPTVLLEFDRGHGLPEDYRSDEPVAAEVAMRVVLAGAEHGGHTWRYTTKKPGADWMNAGFDDQDWKTGRGGFGTDAAPQSIVNTRWNTPDIWLRTTVTITDPRDIRTAQWRLYHDEDVEVHVNGKQALSLKGYESKYLDVPLDGQALAAFRPGENTVAVHCRQTAGGQNVDVGLVVVKAAR
ncbi:MAG: hypothetical protein HY718_17960, partial [Planctomycetes bacterium]|nr:hypothetical protein [Planctomycetota bacterium]